MASAVLLDNASPHTAAYTVETTKKLVWGIGPFSVFPLSGYRGFGPHKDKSRDPWYTSDQGIERCMRVLLHSPKTCLLFLWESFATMEEVHWKSERLWLKNDAILSFLFLFIFILRNNYWVSLICCTAPCPKLNHLIFFFFFFLYSSRRSHKKFNKNWNSCINSYEVCGFVPMW